MIPFVVIGAFILASLLFDDDETPPTSKEKAKEEKPADPKAEPAS